MNQLIISTLEEGLKKIMKETFPLCENENHEVSQLAIKVNNEAHELLKLLEKVEK